MKLPGPPKLWLWIGLVLATAGVVVGGYAYTGDRAYQIEYVAVAVLGFIVMLAGSILAGWAQAQRPRLGEKPRKKKEGEDKPSVLARLRAKLPGGADSDEGGEAVEATVACPSCGQAFDVAGRPPFEATCPECGHEDTVQAPAQRAA